MNIPDIIRFADYLVDRPVEPVRTVLHQGRQMNMVLWQIPPGGKLPAHRHPQGQDIWLVLQGRAELLDDENSGRIIGAGESIVIDSGLIHGVRNNEAEDCVLVSVVYAEAGFEAV
ncbi:cupin domain-containing protein [Neisseria sp. Dent CA1/247]|uniref:cupin domain-containing protein n=1 Tax=Neisseria sp. Dent CA1/247 TaxID=2912675 RepID=UPI001FD595E8|nr:cupin domain-containing protein [Neisseria sp. Dent CA1/247]UOO75886.1 cupin domain-containing protein [Neisseria sp. Dent CA1/247]